MLSNRQLVKIAAYGGFIVVSTGMFFQWKIKERVKQNEYFKEALKILRGHKGAITLLGEPIKDGDFDLHDKDNSCDGYTAKFKLPVRGPKQRGLLYFWAERDVNNNKWNVHRVELEIKNEPDRRLIIRSFK